MEKQQDKKVHGNKEKLKKAPFCGHFLHSARPFVVEEKKTKLRIRNKKRTRTSRAAN